MSPQKALILWVAGFVGLGLIMAGYKGTTTKAGLLNLFTSHLTGGGTFVGTVNPNAVPASPQQGHSVGTVYPASTVSQDGRWYTLNSSGGIGEPLPNAYQSWPKSYTGPVMAM